MSGTATDWLAKAHDDLLAAEILLSVEQFPALIAAFHCQQTVENSLKAFLVARSVPFLYRHDLGYLLDLCRDADPACEVLEPHIAGLTPFAVEMRYPVDLPVVISDQEAQQFHRQAQAVYEFVRQRVSGG
jgi:HEPN domain-containing protein